MISTNELIHLIVLIFTFTATALLTKLLIPFLKSYAKQPIYEEGPNWHMSKSGTPTMGGLSFIIAITVALLLCAAYLFLSNDRMGAISLLLCAAYAFVNALIGVTDDITKLKHKKNAGLTPRAKLILQFIASGAFLSARIIFLNEGTDVQLFFGSVDLGIVYYFASLIILVGITNCANLTDGIDGLATSVAFAIGVSLLYLSYGRDTVNGLICASLIGAALGFLIFNLHPAKIFMGDTGSLFLGSLIASLAFRMKNPFVAVCYSGVFVVEGVSVILQVAYFKLTRKRLFKMAPLHHHLEKCGWDESKICILSIILTLALCIPINLCL